MMVFPEEKYYRLNYIFLASIGLWPYHNSKINQIQVALSLLIYIIFVISQLIQLFVTKYTLDLLLEILSFDFLIMAWASKYISFYAVMKNIKRFQKHVRDNWSILTDDREIDIMRKHAENGKRYTIVIATIIYCGILSYISLQYTSGLLDIIVPLNESRPRKLLIQAEYLVDRQKYFHVLAMHINLVLFLSATTGVATESFSLINAVHVFGMYKIASYRIEHMINKDVLRVCIAQRYTILHHRITAAVDVHRRALELSELLKESFGRSYLILITIIICSGSINLFHFFRIITMKQKILEIGISLLYIACHFLFLILGNFFGQEFINSDSYFHQTICNTKWYNTPLKVQKLILFLLQKTTKSYKLDAGGMFSPCFEGLITTISLLFSFVTVLCSIQ
ncbi:uncharacterized protein [Anoplolepis gracilipes]|uniref:uncharacterized protein isoform X2 n=1 Tax=Anoplolepis gracilipes TaxID=354296 RepID=UPI003BA0736F